MGESREKVQVNHNAKQSKYSKAVSAAKVDTTLFTGRRIQVVLNSIMTVKIS